MPIEILPTPQEERREGSRGKGRGKNERHMYYTYTNP